MPKADATAADLTAMLRRHYLPEGRAPAGVFAVEVESPCGRRRADALWLPTTVTAGKGILIGHEVKVNRGDVIAELTDPTKSDAWARYCNQWWLVVSDPALIDGLTIPEAWGVLAPPSGRLRRTMTIIRSAPTLTGVDQAPALRRLIAWQKAGHEQQVLDAELTIAHLKRDMARLNEQLRDRAAVASGYTVSEETKRVHRLIAVAKERLSAERVWAADIPDDIIIDALVDATATREAAMQTRRDIERLLFSAKQEREPFEIARDAMITAVRLGLKELTAAVPEIAKERS